MGLLLSLSPFAKKNQVNKPSAQRESELGRGEGLTGASMHFLDCVSG